MKILSYLKNFFLIIPLLILFLLIDSSSEKLGSNYEYVYKNKFISSEKGIFADIVGYEYDRNYIIAMKYPTEIYDCENELIYISKPKIQYIIIDKVKKIVYGTYNKNKFELKKNSMNIGLKFDYLEIEEYIKRTKHMHEYKFKRDKKINKCVEQTYSELIDF